MNSGFPSAISTSRSTDDRSPCPGQEVAGDRRRIDRRQRLERDRRVTEDAASPAGPHLEQLRARQREERRGRVTDVGSEVLEQVELGGVGPMDVLEDEHRGLLERDLFGRTDGPRSTAGRVPRPPRPRSPDPISAPRSRVVSSASSSDPISSCTLALSLSQASDAGVRLEDPGHLADLLGERSVAGLAVRKASPLDRARPGRLDPREDLGRDPRLPDPGRPHHRDEMGPELGGRALPDGIDHAELPRPADERGASSPAARPALRWVPARARPRPDRSCPWRRSARAPGSGSRSAWRDRSPHQPRDRRPGPRSGVARPCSRRRPMRAPHPIPGETPSRRPPRRCSPPP